MTAAIIFPFSAKPSLSKKFSSRIFLLIPLVLTWFSVVLFINSNAPQVVHLASQALLRLPSPRSPKVLIVVFSIPHTYYPIARESHVSYAARHGYDFQEVNKYLGNDTRGHDQRVSSLQKLLACTLANNHDYVIVLDRDVVIAPWTPPIHIVAGGLGDKVGIVDENQPAIDARARIIRLRRARDSGVPIESMPLRNATDYYRSFGFNIQADGLLNTGVMLFQPKVHGEWLEKLYYQHVEAQRKSKALFHYEQSMLGNELITRNMYKTLPHAWNRIWVWYNWSSAIGGPEYTMPEVFRQSYFLHFCWAKEDINKMDEWRKEKQFSFAPAPYATDVLP